MVPSSMLMKLMSSISMAMSPPMLRRKHQLGQDAAIGFLVSLIIQIVGVVKILRKNARVLLHKTWGLSGGDIKRVAIFVGGNDQLASLTLKDGKGPRLLASIHDIHRSFGNPVFFKGTHHVGDTPAQHEKHHASDQHDLNESESTFLSAMLPHRLPMEEVIWNMAERMLKRSPPTPMAIRIIMAGSTKFVMTLKALVS